MLNMKSNIITPSPAFDKNLDNVDIFIDIPNNNDYASLNKIFKKAANLHPFFDELEEPAINNNGKSDIVDLNEESNKNESSNENEYNDDPNEDETNVNAFNKNDANDKEKVINQENDFPQEGIQKYINKILNGNLSCILFRSKKTKEVVGILTYETESELTLHIDVIAVDPAHNGKRIGQNLIACAVNQAKLKGFSLVSAYAIGDSHTFWRRLFYDKGKDFFLTKERFDPFIESTISTTSKLFSFLEEDITNQDLRSELTNIINTTKDHSLLKVAHTLEHFTKHPDLNVTEGIMTALSQLLKYMQKSRSANNETNIENSDYFKFLVFVLYFARDIHKLNIANLLQSAIDTVEEKFNLDKSLLSKLEKNLSEKGFKGFNAENIDDEESVESEEDEKVESSEDEKATIKSKSLLTRKKFPDSDEEEDLKKDEEASNSLMLTKSRTGKKLKPNEFYDYADPKLSSFSHLNKKTESTKLTNNDPKSFTNEKKL